ncbi:MULTISPECIES: cobalt ECF transporter T component CbiQ [unclassified Clostridium]|uniref:cobalt ECF transporter T component CbiQ n=1 Tax=unclassified Clostridium TaxID=2614128 RepID=UPI000297A9E3|nr:MULTISPECIES: cobalt ECF transporter T component CbiQ [unclassified Clostridium]EKQ51331.1 MAG: cobalt ABC transporter, permease protein CbiQ [Clostridium sp. Maddingley MBC34-26]
MISIDKLAYISKLKRVNPVEKFVFAIITLIICIALNNILDSIVILFLMTFIIVAMGKIPLKTYVQLMSLPLVFLIIGIITIAVNVVGNDNNLIFSFKIFEIKLGCTYESILVSARLFFKSLGSVSCLYFLTLTTPVFEILHVLRKLRVPRLFVELMGLIYRFIFVLLDTANMIYISQNSRLGYSTFKTSFNSLGQLITSLFISSYKRSQDIYTAMESRCYDGDINLLENKYTYSYKNISLIIVIEVVLIVISFSKNIFGGIY